MTETSTTERAGWRERLRQEELNGYAFAFKARTIALGVVVLWVMVSSSFARLPLLLGAAALFFVVSGVGVAVYSAPLAVSRYLLHLSVPEVSLFTQEVADFVSGQVIGVLLGMAFRWWAFRRFVFPDEDVRRQTPVEPIQP